MSDHDKFSFDLLNINKRWFAVLTKSVTVELAPEGFEKEISRGIYAFASREKRNNFTVLCNNDSNELLALRFDINQNGE